MFAPHILWKTLRSESLGTAFRNYDDVFRHHAAGRCSARASPVSSAVKSSRVNVHSMGRAAASYRDWNPGRAASSAARWAKSPGVRTLR
jgi:hypothetical protein